MSPRPCASTPTSGCFPRVSGDEPDEAYRAEIAAMFSPRERG